MVVSSTFLLFASITSQAADFAYGEALQKSIYFYETQQAGKIPSWNRVPWRGDSVLNDGNDVGLDLSGGWFDAGDHVKFGFPMSSSTTMLAWGAVDYKNAFTAAGQLDEFKLNLRFVNDYLIAAHPSPNEFYGQIGLGGPDHRWWTPAEVVELVSGASRQSFKIDLSCKGADLAAETAAAMSASAMVFRDSDPTYSDVLLGHARDLFDLAIASLGTDGKDSGYANCITDAKDFYNSNFGVYWDEMAWASLWMYRATGEQVFKTRFEEFYPQMGNEDQSTTPVFTWGQGWNDKAYGVYVMAARLFGDQQYHDDAQRWLDHWISPTGGNKTPAGFVIVDRFAGWGSARYAANMAYLSMYYADAFAETSAEYQKYHNFGKRQIDYVLGDNPRNSSYVVGFGNNPPLNVHHRGAHGSWADSLQVPTQQRHILYGAVVGGPLSTDDFDYADDRADFRRNEVATDYNSGFNGAVALLYGKYGGEAIADSAFPPSEGPFEEYFVGAKRNGSASSYIEIKAVIQNKSTNPARAREDLYFRYFVDLSELQGSGLTAADVTVTAPFNQGSGISQLEVWGDPVDNIYYTEIRFDGVNIFPGGQSAFRKEVQFRLSLPANSSVTWDNNNDPSWNASYNSTTEVFGVKAADIPVYGDDGLLFGNEPNSCTTNPSINCVPIALDSSVTTSFQTAASVSLNGTDSDGTIASRTVTVAPQNGVLSGNGGTRSYTPNSGFSGSDSFNFTVTDDQGAESNVATVSISVDAAVVPSVEITSPNSGAEVTVGSNFSLAFNLSNADAVNISIDGSLVATAVSTSPTTLLAPAAAGNFTVEVNAVDTNGVVLAASDTITLSATEAVQNMAPIVSFTTSSSGLTVGFNASASTDPDNGPQALSYSWVFGDGSSATGVSPSHTYATANTYNVMLTVSDGDKDNTANQSVSVAPLSGGVSCEYIIDNEWNSGFVALITLTNNGTSAVNGWTVSWEYAPGTDRTNGWNAMVTGSNPYTASNLAWNAVIQPGQSVSFGMQGTKPNGGTADIPTVTGSVCQ